jgi:hypothetical protein
MALGSEFAPPCERLYAHNHFFNLFSDTPLTKMHNNFSQIQKLLCPTKLEYLKVMKICDIISPSSQGLTGNITAIYNRFQKPKNFVIFKSYLQ